MAEITVQNTEINVIKVNGEDYICLTDMLRAKDGDFFITDWLRNRNTLEYIGIWEKAYISPEFKIYIVEEFQRLKTEEQRLLGWSAKRELSKINYRIHTDAIKQNLVPAEVTTAQASIIYANEADVLKIAIHQMSVLESGDNDRKLLN